MCVDTVSKLLGLGCALSRKGMGVDGCGNRLGAQSAGRQWCCVCAWTLSLSCWGQGECGYIVVDADWVFKLRVLEEHV